MHTACLDIFKVTRSVGAEVGHWHVGTVPLVVYNLPFDITGTHLQVVELGADICQDDVHHLVPSNPGLCVLLV